MTARSARSESSAAAVCQRSASAPAVGPRATRTRRAAAAPTRRRGASDELAVAEAGERAAEIRGGVAARDVVEIDERRASIVDEHVLRVHIAVQAHEARGAGRRGAQRLLERECELGDVGPDGRDRTRGGRERVGVEPCEAARHRPAATRADGRALRRTRGSRPRSPAPARPEAARSSARAARAATARTRRRVDARARRSAACTRQAARPARRLHTAFTNATAPPSPSTARAVAAFSGA